MAKNCNCKGSNLNWCLEWLCDEAGTTCDVGYFFSYEEGKQDPATAFDFPETAITRGGITQGANTTEVNIANTGVYEVTYLLTTNNASAVRYGIQLNADPIMMQTIYAGGQSKFRSGQAFIEVTTAPSILKLISIDDITLDSGGGEYISVSLIIKKVCDL